MTDRKEISNTDLQRIHDLYQQRVAVALAEFVHIDLTIPSQSQSAKKVLAELSTELELLAEA